MDTSTLISPTQGGFHLRARGADGAADGPARNSFVLSHAIEKHLKVIYYDLCGMNRELSREKFVVFLKNVQGEHGLVPMERETYNFHQFLELWYAGYGWNAVRSLQSKEKDLTRPISNYFISSSHNTYLVGNQLSSRSSADAYRAVLKKDCRCIEIDVWNGDALANRWNGDAPPVAPPTSKIRSKSPHPEHRRHLSSQSVADTLEETVSTLRNIISSPHSRNPSTSAPAVAPVAPGAPGAPGNEKGPRESAMSLKENDESIQATQSTQTTQVGEESRERSRASSKSSNRMEPIVMHGWTLTSPVGFRDVCKAIRESAFEKNPLPIIVSLEVHADFEQQEVMVEIMKEEWAGLLLDEPFDECDPNKRQPRLEELLNKILVKVKKQPGKALVPIPSASNPALLATPASTFDDADLSEDERAVAAHPKKGKVPICPALSALAIYTHSEHFKSFDSASARTPGHIFSINEDKILELHTGPKQRELFTHNRNFFMRAFPRGMRVDSSNPDPSLYWRKGVQMVAMNWQRPDEGMMLEHAMFSDEKGWVLKPTGYRSLDMGGIVHHTLDLKITIFAGQHIPLPEARQKSDAGVGTHGDDAFHPLVKVELHVDKSEEAMYKHKTNSVSTDHPDFGKDGAIIEFNDVPKVVEELSFVR
ncbi:PLC-like phosphodiesterase [Thozetella sp. PMI_491]|nr:PLC-like phosphodiesterase [Thozetella sp. PMI_491]